MIDLHLSAFAPRWRFLYVVRIDAYLSIKATNHLNPVIKKENIGINSFPVKKMSPHICSITVIHRIMDKFLRQKILAVPCLQG